MKKYFIFTLISLFLVLCYADSSQLQSYENRGIWFWAESSHEFGSSQILANTLAQEQAIDFLLANSIKRIYGEYQKTAAEQIADWNERLYEAEIESQLLLADNTWLFPRHRHLLLEKLQKELIDFNNSLDNDKQKFFAIHLNLEPHATDIWKEGGGDKRRNMLKLLQLTLDDVQKFLKVNSKDDIKVYYDLVVWYDELGSSIAWKSESDRNGWFSRFSKTVDGLSLMAYSRNFDAILDSTAWEIENLDTDINIAIDADIGENAYWKNRADFEKIMTDLEGHYKKNVKLDIHSFLSFYLPNSKKE